VLLNGAGGGVGSFAIQIAKSFGAEVTGVDSTIKLDMMRLIGADQVIDYTKEDFTKRGQTYDLILDVVASRSLSNYKHSLRPKGKCVLVGGSMSVVFKALFFGSFGSKKVVTLLYKPNKDLASMKELFETGKVMPVIDRRYPLSKVGEAIRHLGEGHVKGKIVITVK
jgi:NADPH:quinone reductase-like Zn-dependent oxidoreductase